MTGVNRALCQFWGSFGIPAYLQDSVPSNAKLPYVTFEAVDGAALSHMVLTAFNWHKRTPRVNTERDAFLDLVAAAIPEGGRRIDLPDGGFLMLYRNSAGFQQYYRDPADRNVVAGRTSYEITYYHV